MRGAVDLYRLVTQFESNRQVADMHSYKLLCRIAKDQLEVRKDGTIHVFRPFKERIGGFFDSITIRIVGRLMLRTYAHNSA